MFNNVGKGYVNKIAGFLTGVFNKEDNIRTASTNEEDLTGNIITGQLVKEFGGDEELAVHACEISNLIKESDDSPQYCFQIYAADNKISEDKQVRLASYFQSRSFDIHTAKQNKEKYAGIVSLADELSPDTCVGSVGNIAVHTADGPFFIIENAHTKEAWVVDASQELPTYIGQAYDSILDAKDQVYSIMNHHRAAMELNAVTPSLSEHNGTTIIGIDNKFYLMDTSTNPPRFSNYKYGSLEDVETDLNSRYAQRGQDKVEEEYILGQTRIKVIYQGVVVMGTILGTKTQDAPHGAIKEFRIELDSPKKIVWIRDSEVIKVYTNPSNKTRKSEQETDDSDDLKEDNLQHQIIRYACDDPEVKELVDEISESHDKMVEKNRKKKEEEKSKNASVLTNRIPDRSLVCDPDMGENCIKIGKEVFDNKEGAINYLVHLCHVTPDDAERMLWGLEKNKTAQANSEVTEEQAMQAAHNVDVNWDTVNFTREAFIKGMNVEMEHDRGSDDVAKNLDDVAKIALVHLGERPDYYERLEKYVEAGMHQLTNRRTAQQSYEGVTEMPVTPAEPDQGGSDAGEGEQSGPVNDLGGLNTQIRKVAKDSFKVELDEEHVNFCMKKAVDVIANEVAAQVTAEIIKAYNPSLAEKPKSQPPPPRPTRTPAPATAAPSPTAPPAGGSAPKAPAGA